MRKRFPILRAQSVMAAKPFSFHSWACYWHPAINGHAPALARPLSQRNGPGPVRGRSGPGHYHRHGGHPRAQTNESLAARKRGKLPPPPCHGRRRRSPCDRLSRLRVLWNDPLPPSADLRVVGAAFPVSGKRRGSPKCLCTSLRACHDLRPRQALGIQSAQCLLCWLPRIVRRRRLCLFVTGLNLFSGGAAPLTAHTVPGASRKAS